MGSSLYQDMSGTSNVFVNSMKEILLVVNDSRSKISYMISVTWSFKTKSLSICLKDRLVADSFILDA